MRNGKSGLPTDSGNLSDSATCTCFCQNTGSSCQHSAQSKIGRTSVMMGTLSHAIFCELVECRIHSPTQLGI